MATVWNITADSTPVLDGWGWADYWSINDWMQWHSFMLKAYGKAEANRRFLEQWAKQDSDANPVEARTFNAKFRQYARDNGFFDQLFSRGISGIVKPLGWITDLLTTADHAEAKTAGTVENLSTGVSTSGKILKFGLPALVIIALVIAAVYIYRKAR